MDKKAIARMLAGMCTFSGLGLLSSGPVGAASNAAVKGAKQTTTTKVPGNSHRDPMLRLPRVDKEEYAMKGNAETALAAAVSGGKKKTKARLHKKADPGTSNFVDFLVNEVMNRGFQLVQDPQAKLMKYSVRTADISPDKLATLLDSVELPNPRDLLSPEADTMTQKTILAETAIQRFHNSVGAIDNLPNLTPYSVVRKELETVKQAAMNRLEISKQGYLQALREDKEMDPKLVSILANDLETACPSGKADSPN